MNIQNIYDEAASYLASPHTVYRAAWTVILSHARDALDRAGTNTAIDSGEYADLLARVRRLRVREGIAQVGA